MEQNYVTVTPCIGNESVPIQLAQCWLPGLAISAMLIYRYIFQIKHTEAISSNNTRKLLWFEISKMLTAVKNEFIVSFIIVFGTLSFHIAYLAIRIFGCKQRRRNGGGEGVARPSNVETTGARVSFRPRNIFPHYCMLFLKLPLFVVMLPTYN